MLKWFLKYRIWLLFASALLLLLSYKISHFKSNQSELQSASVTLERKIENLSAQFYKQFTNQYLANAFSYHKLTKADLVAFNQLPYELLVYKNDSLVFWSDNKIIPSQSPQSFADSAGFENYKNGYYLSLKKTLSGKSGKTISLIALTQIKSDYSTTNSFLRNHFDELFDLPSYIILSVVQQKNYEPVKTLKGKVLFYIGIDEAEELDKAGSVAAVFFFLSILLFMFFVIQFLNQLEPPKRSWISLITIAIVFAGILVFISNKSALPDDVENWKIFNPSLFASSGIANSLGALLIQMLLLLWISTYLSARFQLILRPRRNSIDNYLYHFFGYFTIYLLVIYSVNVFQALVKDSMIEFAFLNPLEPDYFSILGVLCISMILFCIFLLSEKIFSILKRNPLSVVDTLLILLICSLLTGAYFLWSANGLPGLVVILWTVLFILILPYFGIRELGKLNITKIFLVVIFFCVSGASVLYYYGTQKEKLSRITYAKKLITDRDAVTEFLLSGLKNKIIEDPFVIQYFKSKQLSGKELDDRLRQLYFTEGFDRYTIHFYPFDQDGYLLYGSSNEFGSVTERGIKQGMQSIGTKDLFYSSSATENITYLNQFKIESNDSLLGSLYVSLESNSYNNSGVYPELLLSEKDKLPNVTPEYSYAIYNKRINSSAKANAQSSFQLVDGAGAFNYDYKLKWKFIEDEEFQFIEEAGSNHLVYHPKQDMLIVVTSSNIPALYFLSYFSFLFVVIFSLVAIILIFNLVFIYPRIKSVKNFMQYASMRSLIQGFFLIFILIMIIVIGYVTGQFFLRQFNTIAKTTVEEKMERVTETVSFMFKEHQVSEPDDAVTSSLLRNHIGQISEVQGNEVNFYNRTGDLITSSQPGIFEKGIISRKINPLAYYDLRKETQTMVVTEEKIGRLSFYSGYQTIRNENGKVLAYLNLPYYNSRENLNEQVGFFFVALVNILVIAIIVAGLMAPLISKQITLKLSLVAEKFKGVKVGSSNELIEWYANDEIGSLVNEYNKMILELKKSADRLVNTQRELAWREMAKQVAHEIKNPLTPMKLSIQHLQRAYAQDAPNLKELTEKVSKTLIEQIDNLSDIATVFSNFAKMPKAEIENVDVNEILRSVYELHKESGNAVIHLHTNAEQCVVSADKNHLISLFNNLILNAIQAIPQERMGRIDVITENSEGNLIISITDDGVGISEEEREKVFVPNFTTKSSGTGLGLAYSKKVAESFSGTISFTSQINVGTTFYVSLPLIDDLVSS